MKANAGLSKDPDRTRVEGVALHVVAVHPGAVLADYLEHSGYSARKVARELGVAVTTVTNVLRQRNGITADMALGLEDIFARPALLWLTMQLNWDLEQAHARRAARAERAEQV